MTREASSLSRSDPFTSAEVNDGCFRSSITAGALIVPVAALIVPVAALIVPVAALIDDEKRRNQGVPSAWSRAISAGARARPHIATACTRSGWSRSGAVAAGAYA